MGCQSTSGVVDDTANACVQAPHGSLDHLPRSVTHQTSPPHPHTGSTPRASSSESRRFSGDTKTSSSGSTSSCQRCVFCSFRSRWGRVDAPCYAGDTRCAIDRGTRVAGTAKGFQTTNTPTDEPREGIPASTATQSRPSITRQLFRISRRVGTRLNFSRYGCTQLNLQ